MTPPRQPHRQSVGFTLIELLIVVAIIAILAAIAVPNFLEAQTRSKVSRVKSDMRSLATAIESYYTDNNHYPIGRNGLPYPGYTDMSWPIALENRLTTPISYFSSVNLEDPFNPHEDGLGQFTRASLQYHSFEAVYTPPAVPDPQYASWWDLKGSTPPHPDIGYDAWHLCSWGPDNLQNGSEWLALGPPYVVNGFESGGLLKSMLYDPTNGTVSDGDIPRFGGAIPPTIGVQAANY